MQQWRETKQNASLFFRLSGKKIEREEGIYFRLVGVSFCVSAAEVNNPQTPSCASRHLESEGSYFIAGKENRLRPAKIQIFRKCTEKETEERESWTKWRCLGRVRSMKSFCFKIYEIYIKFCSLIFQSLILWFFDSSVTQCHSDNINKFLTSLINKNW